MGGMIEIIPTPDVVPGHCLKRYTSQAAEGLAGIVVKSKAGKVYGGHVDNVAAATVYCIMLFDKAVAPVNGDTPIWRQRVAAVSGGDILLPVLGVPFVNGLGWAISSTFGTLTLAVSADALATILFA